MPPSHRPLFVAFFAIALANNTVLAQEAAPAPAPKPAAETAMEPTASPSLDAAPVAMTQPDSPDAKPTREPPKVSTEQEIPAGKARIIFYRPKAFFGAGMRAEIYVDGVKVARSLPGKRFQLDIDPGESDVVVPNEIYSGQRGLKVTLAAGETAYVRTSIGGSGFGGRTNVELIDAGTGEKESAGLNTATR